MKKPNINLTKRRVYFGLLGLLVLANLAASAWLVTDYKNAKKDLYAVRDDYYGNTDYGKQRHFADYGIEADETDEDAWNPDFEVLSQEVKAMNIYSGYDKDTGEDEFESKDIRIVKVKVTNDTESVYTYYEGDLGYEDENGRIIRSTSVNSEEDLNLKANGPYGSTVELAPGGEAEVYIYFIDTGKEITELTNFNYGV